jgi:ElaB/YqjD/DUF883 family membrane-anchored ribosome-binding protein
MVNPNDNDLTSDEPQLHPREEEAGSSGREQSRRAIKKASTARSQAPHGTLEKAGRALERTEYFVRENPVPTILGALGLGIAIGLAIRYASESEQKAEIEVRSPLGNLKWSVLSLPFVWRFLESAKDKYERSADSVADAMKDGVKRLKRIKVDRYAKPVRKRWRAWTR